MMAWSSGEANQKSQSRSMNTADSSHQVPPASESHVPHHVMRERELEEEEDEDEEEDEEDEDVEEAVDVLGREQDRVMSIGAYGDDEEEEDDDESSYRVSSIDEACVSKTESSCPSSADSLGLDSLGMRRSLSPRHHPLLSPMHMGKAIQPPRQVSPARSDVGVSTSSRAGCKRSVSSAINDKELLSLPPSHSLPVSPLFHRKVFASRSPQRSFSHSRMTSGRSLTRLCETVVTISAPPHSSSPLPIDDDDEQRRRMRDILQNLPLAEIYKKRARRNNQGLDSCSTIPSGTDSTPASAGAQSGMEVLIHTPHETPPLSASSSGRHNFKKALRDRYLLSQSYRGGGSHGGSSSSQDSAASVGKIPLDLTSERFTKIREPLKSETDDLISPHLMLTDDTNPNSPMDPPIIPSIPSILQHPPSHNLPHHPLHLSSHGGSLGDDDAFYPTASCPSNQSAVAAAVAVQLIARTCRIESSSSSYLSVDMDSDPFSPMSPMSPCMISPKQQPPPVSSGPPSGHHLTPNAPPSHHLLQPAVPTSGPWIQPPPSVPSIGVPRGGTPYIPGPPHGACPTSAIQHPGAIPIPRQCQSAPQTPHSSPQIRSHFFFPPHGSQMPPPPQVLCGGLQPASTLAPTSSTLSSPGLSPGADGRAEGGTRVNHACPVCSRSFSRSDMLSRHMRLHTGLKPYECANCGQSFSRSDHLNTHIRTHTGEKPYHCPQCSYSACRRDMITRHMKVHRRKLTASAPSASASPPPTVSILHSSSLDPAPTTERGGEG